MLGKCLRIKDMDLNIKLSHNMYPKKEGRVTDASQREHNRLFWKLTN